VRHDQPVQHYAAPQAPRFQAPQPQYRAPSFPAPARRVSAPAPRPAPANGKRRWPP
jgi:hypothetical protein